MHSITRRFTFDMGHRITNTRCYNPHGHTYKLEVTVSDVLDECGMVMDFVDLNRKVNELVVDVLDHSFICYSQDSVLRDFFEKNDFKVNLVDFETTAENLAEWIYHKLVGGGLKVSRIRLYETPNSRADYVPDHAPAGSEGKPGSGPRVSSEESDISNQDNNPLPLGGD